jgi:hypothetical protein
MRYLPLLLFLAGCVGDQELRTACGNDYGQMYVGMPVAKFRQCYLRNDYGPTRTEVVGGLKQEIYSDPHMPGNSYILVQNGQVAGWTGKYYK